MLSVVTFNERLTAVGRRKRGALPDDQPPTWCETERMFFAIREIILTLLNRHLASFFISGYPYLVGLPVSDQGQIHAKGMKDRATIVCRQKDRLLLVARSRSRWSLPGGTIRPSESPLDAARRELEEETGLSEIQLAYLFQFCGFSKMHHVFCADIALHASPRPSNEITRCHWFSPTKIATLSASVPTREIVDLFVRYENRYEIPATFADGERKSVKATA
jgi:8-oxo-dGTP diphosphatase